MGSCWLLEVLFTFEWNLNLLNLNGQLLVTGGSFYVLSGI